jgi:precorrin-6B methylase 2
LVKYRLEIDRSRELILNIPDGVFVPTGTTQALLKAVRQHVKNPGKLLDLGCGCGAVGIALQKIGLVKGSLYASDLSEEGVNSTKENARQHQCPIVVKSGGLFEPWENEKFDFIVDDVSGVSKEVAKISPWFNKVPCDSGYDGTSLVVEVIQKADSHLNFGGRLFFPIVSFSNVNKILMAARKNFLHVERLVHEEWPLPKEMNRHIVLLKRLQEEGHIQFVEKFGMVLWFTDIYVAYNYHGNQEMRDQI